MFTGKVVKTTTFGAFVELSKGTDGLLHISNIKPGERAESVEDVVNRGDELDVRVVEVDKERGRIGLRLADDPEIAGKTAEELAADGHRRQGRRGGGDRGGRGGDRGRDGAAAAADAVAATATGGGGDRRDRDSIARPRPMARRAHAHRARLGRPGRHRGDALGALGRARASGSASARATRRSSRPGSRTSSSTCCSRAPTRFSSSEIDQIFDGLGAEVNAGTGKETTSVYARFLDEHLERAFDVMADMVLRPTYPDIDSERQVVIEEIAMYEDEPQDKVHDVLSPARLRRPPARPAGDRPRRGDRRTCRCRDIAAYHDDRYMPRHDRGRGGRQRRARADRGAGASRPAAADAGAADGRALRAPRRRRRPRGRASTRRRPSSTTSASAGPGIPRDDDRRFALRVLDTILGGSTLLAPVPGGAREARPRLLGLLVRRASTRTRARSASTSARARTTSARRWR